MKKLLLSTAASAALLALSAVAEAGPLTFDATAGPVWSIALAPGTMLWATGKTGFSTSAHDSLGDAGTATFGPEMMEASTATPPVYPVIKQSPLPGESLTVDLGAAGQLVGDVVWTKIMGGNPDFFGVFDYSTTGNPALLALFGASGTLDLNLAATGAMMTLEQWDATFGPIGLVSGGEGTRFPMSEPTSLALLGTALLGLGMWRQRRDRATHRGAHRVLCDVALTSSSARIIEWLGPGVCGLSQLDGILN